jgi:dCTP deaminase
MLLVDHQIAQLIKNWTDANPADIQPCGYDLWLGENFLIPEWTTDYSSDRPLAIDPFNPPIFKKVKQEYALVVPPNSFVLGESVEYIKMPSDTLGICLGRSTYARAGIITNITPLEPGWEGRLTIEISNSNPLPVLVYPNKAICQVIFLQADIKPLRDYVQKGGRYNKQVGVTQGKLDI